MIKEKKVYDAASISKHLSRTMATDAMGPDCTCLERFQAIEGRISMAGL